MVSHPNRGKGKPGRNPTPHEIAAYRSRHGFTVEQASALIWVSPDTWRAWEAPMSKGQPGRRMHPAFWELLQRIERDLDEPPSPNGT